MVLTYRDLNCSGASPTYIRSQDKGSFSKGGFCSIQRHTQEAKDTPKNWAQHHIWQSERHREERSNFAKQKKKNLQPPPLFSFLITTVTLNVLAVGVCADGRACTWIVDWALIATFETGMKRGPKKVQICNV